VVQLGYLDSDEKISAAYSSADIFILPSLEDNLPNTMLEAMSCGTPVVAFDVGGMSDVVINQVTGQLVPMGDVKEMGKAILSLILNTEQREWMGKECIQAQRYLELYQELIDPHASTAEAISEDHTSRVWEVPVSLKGESLSVTLEPGVGSHFKDIYDQVLFKALKRHAPYVQKQWQASEADRIARLKVIEELGEKLEASEADRIARLKVIEELGEKLQSAEAQSKARMGVIKRQEKEYSKKIKEIEEDREARLQVIERQQEEFSEKMQEIEADRAARLEVIKALGKQNEDNKQKINELQDFDIRSLGFNGACSIFLKKLFRMFSKN
jgi:hypothetical protein